MKKFGRNSNGSEDERSSDPISLPARSTLIDQRDDEARIKLAAHWLVIGSKMRL